MTRLHGLTHHLDRWPTYTALFNVLRRDRLNNHKPEETGFRAIYWEIVLARDLNEDGTRNGDPRTASAIPEHFER